MKLYGTIKDKKLITDIDLTDGYYQIDIKPKDKSKTYEQVKKLWATIDDISIHEYGDTSQSTNIYLQILSMSGVRVDTLIIKDEALNDLKKKVRAMNVVSREVINHQPHSVVKVCLTGISEMSKYEVMNVIDTAIKWCGELGIETELNDDTGKAS